MTLEILPPSHAKHTWESLVGNRLVADAIRRSIDEHRMPHGVLFHGPEQVGKTGFAIAATKNLIAGEWPPSSEAARKAVAKIERSTHPDVVYLRPDMRAGKALQIKIEDVREVERMAPLSPIESQYRVVIIDGADRMNPNTANSLLKVLEEPPPHCKFILIAGRRGALLPTVISRCTPLRLGAVPAEELTEWLVRQKGMSREQARLAARWSEGRPGAALALPLEAWEERLATVGEIMRGFIGGDFSAVFRASAELLKLGEVSKSEGESGLAATLRWLRLWLRDRMVVAAAPGENRLLAREAAAQSDGDGWTLETLSALGDEVEKLWPYAERSIDSALALETILTRVGAARAKVKA